MTVKKCMLMMALLACPTVASAWESINRHTVNPLPGGGFEVIGEPGSGGVEYWCAAGDYATRVLGAPGPDRIYITRGRGAPDTSNRSNGVQFSLAAPGVADVAPGLLLRMNRVGDNLSVAFARNYCFDKMTLDN